MYEIPEGYRFVKYDVPKKNEYYLINGNPIKSVGCNTVDYPIVEKIPEQEQQTQEGLKLQYKTQQGDWRDVNDGYEYRIKPKTKIVRFRNYLNKAGIVKTWDKNHTPDLFVKWLGDWQEVEIEEND